MSTPPTWSAPDQDRPDPFAVPAPAPAPAAEPAPFEAPAAAAPSQASPYGPPAATEQASPYGPPAGSPVAAPSPSSSYASTPGPGSGQPPYGGAPAYGAPPFGGPPSPPPYGGPPTPGQPYGPGGYYPPPGAWGPPQPPVDGLAIASLVTSGVGLFSLGATGPVGLGLGIAALARIRRSGARGRGLAIGGIVAGGVMTLLLAGFIALVAFAASQPSNSVEWDTTWDEESLGSDPWSSDEEGATSTSTPVYELAGPFEAGQCLAGWPELYDMSDALVVDCAEPHGAEVIGGFELTAAPWAMGADPAVDRAWEDCWETLDAFGSPAVDAWGSLDVYYPHPAHWEDGEKAGYCVAVSYGTVTGSLVGQTLAVDDGVLS